MRPPLRAAGIAGEFRLSWRPDGAHRASILLVYPRLFRQNPRARPKSAANFNFIRHARAPARRENPMEYFVKSSNPEKQRVACVVVGVFERRTATAAAETIDRESKGT